MSGISNANHQRCALAVVLLKPSGEWKAYRCAVVPEFWYPAPEGKERKGIIVRHYPGHALADGSTLALDADTERMRPNHGPAVPKGCGFGFWYQSNATDAVRSFHCGKRAAHSGFHMLGRGSRNPRWSGATLLVFSDLPNRVLATAPGLNYALEFAGLPLPPKFELPVPKRREPVAADAPTMEQIQADAIDALRRGSRRVLHDALDFQKKLDVSEVGEARGRAVSGLVLKVRWLAQLYGWDIEPKKEDVTL